MKQRFTLLARSRANYYTQGSPIQFIQVELLQEASSGEVAVCLSFKNVSDQPLQGLSIRFKCRSAAGETVCNSAFCYDEILAQPGEIFGAEKAVYLSAEPLSSVEVQLESVLDEEGERVPLAQYRRVKLPAQRPLEEPVRTALVQKAGNDQLMYEPAVLEEGWQCGCGAFHLNREEGVYCDECGADRILVQNMIASLRRSQLDGPLGPTVDEQPTRMAPARTEEPTRMAAGPVQWRHGAEEPAGNTREEELGEEKNFRYDEAEDYEEYDEQEEFLMREERARLIIRWAPIVTGVLCALVVAIGFAWYQLLM